MTEALTRALRIARRGYMKFAADKDPFGVSFDADLAGQAASDLIRTRIEDDRPVMIARFGLNELSAVLTYLAARNGSILRKSAAYVRGNAKEFWWEPALVAAMSNNAGFFPPDTELLNRFCSHMLDAMADVDVLGSWLKGERVVAPYLRKPVKVRLRDLEPYYHADPWTEALAGRDVLIVHPYSESIRRQYAKRTQLFSDGRVLPEFNLLTLRAVQSIAGSDPGFRDWFEAYDAMAEQLAELEFDVAIIGCGAYGFPLAAHVKRLGKKAVHLGGATQILFGIKGKRWDQHEFISQLFNEHWARPLASEHPEGYMSIEEGCYW